VLPFASFSGARRTATLVTGVGYRFCAPVSREGTTLNKGMEAIALALAMVLAGLQPGKERLAAEQEFVRLVCSYLSAIEREASDYLRTTEASNNNE